MGGVYIGAGRGSFMDLRGVSLNWFEGVISRARAEASRDPRWPWFLVLTLGVTGARIGEVIGNASAGVEGLRVHDFEYQGPTMLVRIITEKVRTRTPRYVPLPSWYPPILDRYVIYNGIGDKLFNVSRNHAERVINKLIGTNPHKLRHGFALYSLYRGVTPEEVRRLMGHSSIKMQFEYMKVVGLGPGQLRSPFQD